MLSTFSSLCKDPNNQVRKTVSGGFHEVWYYNVVKKINTAQNVIKNETAFIYVVKNGTHIDLIWNKVGNLFNGFTAKDDTESF